VVTGYWIRDYDIIQLRNTKNHNIKWIYRWTHWATCWQPAQFWWVGRFPSNCTGIDILGHLTIQATNLATVQFNPDLDPRRWYSTIANTTSWLAGAPEIWGSDSVESSWSIIQKTREFILGRCYQGHSLNFAHTGPRCYELQVWSLGCHSYILTCNSVPDAQQR